LAAVREDQATADLAQLMPAEALAYVEISDVGAHIEQLVRMLNLHAEAGEATSGRAVALGDGLYLPDRVTISPALLEELKNIRGVAAALTGVTPDGLPQGVVVVHPGDSNVLRGLVETAIQVLQPAEPVGGFPAYTYEHHVWIVQTARMLVVGSSQDEVASAVARLQKENTGSLPETEAFAQMDEERENATLFAWFSGPRVVEQLREKLQGEEAQIASAVLDLEHLDSLSVAVGPTEHGLKAQVKLNLQEGHRNLAYALVRTAPLSGRAQKYVPSGIAGLALVGLNPAGEERQALDQAAPRYVAAMDFGRELFSNIEELGFFVLPRADGTASKVPLPEMALVIAVGDAARSQALWNQLLAIPAMAMPQLPPPSDVEIGGQTGKEFQYPDAPPLLLVRLADDGIVLGTRGAVAAAIDAGADDGSIATDAEFQPLLDQLTPASSKAILVDVGRALETAASVAPPRDANQMRFAGSLVGNLRVSLVTDEQPTSLAVRLQATNLPDVQRIIDVALTAQERHSIVETSPADGR
jgi:hypothetical protein